MSSWSGRTGSTGTRITPGWCGRANSPTSCLSSPELAQSLTWPSQLLVVVAVADFGKKNKPPCLGLLSNRDRSLPRPPFPRPPDFSLPPWFMFCLGVQLLY